MGCGASTPPPELTAEEKNGIATRAVQDLLIMCVEQGAPDAKEEESWPLDIYKVVVPGGKEMIAKLAKFKQDVAVKAKEMQAPPDAGFADKAKAKAAEIACTAAEKASEAIKNTIEGPLQKEFSEGARKIVKEKDFKKVYIAVIEEQLKVRGALDLCISGKSTCSYFNESKEVQAGLLEALPPVVEKGLNSGFTGGGLPKAIKSCVKAWNELSEQAEKVGLVLEKKEFDTDEYMRVQTIRCFLIKMGEKEKAILEDPQAVSKKQSKCIPTAFGNKDHVSWRKVKGVNALPIPA